MSYSGKGNSGDVLKVNAQNKTTYQQITLPVTVASGSALTPDYNTISAALNAGAENILVIGDTFETQSIFASGAISLTLEANSLLDLGIHTFGGVGPVDIKGNGRLRWAKDSLLQPVFTVKTSIADIELINNSTELAPIMGSADCRILNCSITGDTIVGGSGLLITGCAIRGGVTVIPSASGMNMQQCHIINGLVVDSGNNTVLSNIKFN